MGIQSSLFTIASSQVSRHDRLRTNFHIFFRLCFITAATRAPHELGRLPITPYTPRTNTCPQKEHTQTPQPNTHVVPGLVQHRKQQRRQKQQRLPRKRINPHHLRLLPVGDNGGEEDALRGMHPPEPEPPCGRECVAEVCVGGGLEEDGGQELDRSKVEEG
mmetsp:Transcript_13236/g.13416  ORF Transcript_13236/g.13416 Transcript_13236/m.13416 type:complete len:161 (-) Transcript_13236:520-1002(-)